MNTIKFEYKIEQDMDAPNPRKEFDQLGHMVCWHRNYILGDVHSFSDPEDFRTTLAMRFDDSVERRIEWWNNEGYTQLRKKYDHHEAAEEVDAAVRNLIAKVLEKHIIVLPLYLYDHGGITMNTSGFSCGWDSGQVGYIYMTREEVLREWGKGGRRLTKALRKQAEDYLKAEVAEYDQYLTGDVWGYIIDRVEYDEDGDEVDRKTDVESCWGFFGDEYCEEEAERVVAYLVEKEAVDTERRTFPVGDVGI